MKEVASSQLQPVVGRDGLEQDQTANTSETYQALLLKSFTWRYGNNQDVWSNESALHQAAQWIFRGLNGAAGKRVLDIGIGTGANLIPVLAAGHRVTGLDIVEPKEWAELRRRWGTQIELVKTGFLDWQEPSIGFDLVCDLGCLHHQLPTLYDEYLSKIRKYLRPDGQFALCVYKEPDSGNAEGRTDVTDHGRLAKCFTYQELQGLLQRNHFNVLSSKEFARPELPMDYLVTMSGISASTGRI